MRGFLRRAGAALGRAIVSLGYGPRSGEAPPVDDARGCMSTTLAATGTMDTAFAPTGTMTTSFAATGVMATTFEVC